jgi:hypothetical protein
MANCTSYFSYEEPSMFHCNPNLPPSFTLDACRHGGMTELEEAKLTDGQGRALFGHNPTPDMPSNLLSVPSPPRANGMSSESWEPEVVSASDLHQRQLDVVGIPRAQNHAIHSAVHRDVIDEVQGFLEVRVVGDNVASGLHFRCGMPCRR